MNGGVVRVRPGVPGQVLIALPGASNGSVGWTRGSAIAPAVFPGVGPPPVVIMGICAGQTVWFALPTRCVRLPGPLGGGQEQSWCGWRRSPAPVRCVRRVRRRDGPVRSARGCRRSRAGTVGVDCLEVDALPAGRVGQGDAQSTGEREGAEVPTVVEQGPPAAELEGMTSMVSVGSVRRDGTVERDQLPAVAAVVSRAVRYGECRGGPTRPVNPSYGSGSFGVPGGGVVRREASWG